MKIDPALRGKRPCVSQPAPFTSADGRFHGWKVQIPGRHSLASPAVVNNRVFLGGGFGSYDFYAFNAVDGALEWHYQTSDDGPTAAVVADDHVVFNTESCELEVLTIDGKPVWKKWLGDPLMSMPAAADGRIYMAYPDSTGDRRHFLACFDLRNGTEYWKQPIAGEVITAPVLAEGHVHFATLGGTLYRLRQSDGRIDCEEERNATSSPAVWEGECYFSQREEIRVHGSAGTVSGSQQTEHFATRGFRDARGTARHYSETTQKADYLDHAKRVTGSPRYTASALHDTTVGFANFKGDSKMDQATHNLGHSHVHSIWAYQGSKPFVSKSRLYAAHGATVTAADTQSEQIFWKKNLKFGAGAAAADGDADADAAILDSPFAPPVIVNGKLFIGSTSGDIHCLSAESGETLWTVPVGEPIVFQPAVAGGRVYVGTDSGSLISFATGEPADDGWLMWGADAAHNGLCD